MGGQVGVSSRGLNQGTTFWFTLPTKELKASQINNENDPELMVKIQREPTYTK